MKIERFEDIKAWQLGRELSKMVYRFCLDENFAKDWGLRDQITRAAGSVMHNIAEGFDAGYNNEFVRFLGYAKRSCSEVQSELYVALDQKYINEADFKKAYNLAGEARAAVIGFINYLKKS